MLKSIRKFRQRVREFKRKTILFLKWLFLNIFIACWPCLFFGFIALIDSSYLLVFLLFLPLIVMCSLLFFDAKFNLDLRRFGLLLSLNILTYVCCLSFFFFFNPYGLCYGFTCNFLPVFNLYFILGFDGISIFFILLSALLIPICILASWNVVTYKYKIFLSLLFFIEFLLFNVFLVLDLFLFYIFFESILIPMYILIGVWGSRERKMYAAYLFFLYTLFGSVFMLLGIFYLYGLLGALDIYTLWEASFSLSKFAECVLWCLFFFAMAVKIPMVPVHLWLPEAHVEAPTTGSVLLAGILLKMGGYGFIRFLLPVFPYASCYFRPLVYILSIVAIIYASLTTIRQIDLKKIIAYSSVAHMNFVTIGIFSNNLMGVNGAIYLMFSHGIVSSALFLLIGLLYERYGTRLLFYYGGLVIYMPIFSFFFLFFTLANMSLPGTSSFIGEFLLLVGAFFSNKFTCFLMSVGVILGAIYAIWLYNRVCYGVFFLHIFERFADLNKREFFYMLFLVFFCLFFGIYSSYILYTINISVIMFLFSQF